MKILLIILVIVFGGYAYYKIQTAINPDTSTEQKEPILREHEQESSDLDIDIIPDSIVPKQETAIIPKSSFKEKVTKQQKTKEVVNINRMEPKDENELFQLFEDKIAEDFKKKSKYSGEIYDSDDFFKNETPFDMEINSDDQDSDSLAEWQKEEINTLQNE